MAQAQPADAVERSQRRSHVPERFFTTALNDTAQRSFQVRVRDDGGTANGGANLSTAATVTVNVTPVNDRPIANAQTLSTLEDVELPITLTGQDGAVR